MSDSDDDDVSPHTASRAPVTSSRELNGWYCYGIAAEVFAVTGAGSFLPVTIEQLARENGVLYSDRSRPCVGEAQTGNSTSTLTSASTRNLLLRATATASKAEENNQCIINLLGSEMTTASFAMYTVSVAVFVQALALVSISPLADYGNYRKRLLIMFAMAGSVTSMCFIFVVPSIYPVAAVLAVVAITCLGCSFVMLNSFLPVLTANHPSVRTPSPAGRPGGGGGGGGGDDASESPSVLDLSNKISARGVGLGYAAALFVQLCSILILYLTSKVLVVTDKTIPLRIILLVAGLWWCTFSIPTAFWLRDRPGPPLPAAFLGQKYTSTSTSRGPTSSSSRRNCTALSFAWSSVYKTLKLALSLPQARLFLLGWFLLSDATTTVSSTAILFARTELNLSPVGIACLSITATSSGIVGAVFWPLLSHRMGWRTTNRTIIACLCLMELIPLYGLLYLLPPVQRLGWLGLQQPWEIFPLAVIHGTAMAGFSAYCRSLFGQLIPPGHEAAFYALFAITDKGSSAVGPAVVGSIVDATGSIRPAFWFLLVLVGLPIGIVALVDEKKGRMQAVRASNRLPSLNDGDGDGGTELLAAAAFSRHHDDENDIDIDIDIDREQREGLMSERETRDD